MEIDEAIMMFTQSEKIKAGIIWASQIIGMVQGLPDGEKKGGEKVVGAILNMIAHETKLAGNVVGGEGWDEIEAFIDKALVMVNSGVGHEAGVHLSKALSKATNFGQQSMSFLQEKGQL